MTTTYHCNTCGARAEGTVDELSAGMHRRLAGPRIMADRAAEMVRLICQRKGTYDSGEIYDALFKQTRGNPPLDQRGIGRLISVAPWSRDTGEEHWRPEGEGEVQRSRKLKVFAYQEVRENGNP